MTDSMIYLDYNATTPIHPEVGKTMIPFITSNFGNPSSSHHYGAVTKKACTHARVQVAQLLNCHPEEIIFTSGGTESNNYAIKGVVETALLRRRNQVIHCITSKIEHPSVMEVFKFLEQRYGARVQVTYCSVDSNGAINLEEVNQALRKETVLVSVMHSNNEVGTLQPIREIGKLIRAFEKSNQLERNSILLHTDAAQSIGKVLISLYDKQLFDYVENEEQGRTYIDRDALKKSILELGPFVHNLYNDEKDSVAPVHLLSVCTHKFYGPKGVGALFVRRNCGIELQKQMHGASVHEKGFRSGTENVILLVGLGKACELSLLDMKSRIQHMKETRDLLHSGILRNVQGITVKLNGHPEERLPNTLNISFAGIEANTILDDISDFVAASAGSACHSSPHEEDSDETQQKHIVISQILSEMGVDVNIAMGTIRFSTGLLLTKEQVHQAVEIISKCVKSLTPTNMESVDMLPSKQEDVPSLLEIPNNQTDVEENMLSDVIQSVVPSSRNLVAPTMKTDAIRLTSTTHGLGCGCKINMNLLSTILKKLPEQPRDSNVLVGTETSDDCGVYRLGSDLALCTTVDFFTPIVDSPFDFGQIACANALSDVYAMGGDCKVALNIVAFPVKRLPLSVLETILRGAQEKATEAGVQIVGGHSIEDNEPKFGMCVQGIVHPDRMWRNVGSKKGDIILLTKPIGTGVLTTALKKGMIDASSRYAKECIKWMSTLNKMSSEILRGKFRKNNPEQPYSVHGCTDVTGFGLLGHLKEMMSHCETEEGQLCAKIVSQKVPLMDGAYEMILSDVIPGGTINNQKYVSSVTKFEENVSPLDRTLLCDAQTSGGLMFSVPESEVQEIVSDFERLGISIWQIGSIEIIATGDCHRIHIV